MVEVYQLLEDILQQLVSRVDTARFVRKYFWHHQDICLGYQAYYLRLYLQEFVLLVGKGLLLLLNLKTLV